MYTRTQLTTLCSKLTVQNVFYQKMYSPDNVYFTNHNVDPLLCLCYISSFDYSFVFLLQWTRLCTWWAVTGLGLRSTSSWPRWRRLPRECLCGEATTSSPTSQTTTRQTTSRGSGTCRSRRTGTSRAPRRHSTAPLRASAPAATCTTTAYTRGVRVGRLG